MTVKKIPDPDQTAEHPPLSTSSFAGRRAEREAEEAAGIAPSPRRGTATIRAGLDAPQPVITVTRREG